MQFGPPPAGVEGLPPRQLLPGNARTSGDAQVRAKYIEFFESEGFPAEAAAFREFVAATPASGAKAEASRLSNSSTGQAGAAPSSGRQLAAFAKALQAVRSTRAIQSAWRKRKDSEEGGGCTTVRHC